jgi:spoIIIJ-associated protein
MSVIKHEIEARGADVDAAVESGLGILGTDRDSVVVEVLDEGSRGLLGIGKRDAVVRLTLMVDTQEKKAPEKVAPPPPVAPAPPPAKATPAKPKEDPPAKQPVATPTTPKPKEERPAAPKEERVEVPPATPTPAPAPIAVEKPVVEVDPAVLTEILAREEVVVAMKHMETLLEKMGIEAIVSAEPSEIDEVTNQRIPIITVDGDNLNPLIGSRGATLNAIQFLLRQMTSQSVHERTTFALDIAGYRERRQQVLAELAQRMADKVADEKRTITLNAMPPHERRIIHMTLREDQRVETSSTGEGDRRRVRIMPQNAGGGKRRSRPRQRRNGNNRDQK